MAGNHATGTAGVLGSSELNRDTAGLQGTYGWAVQSGAVTFSTGLTFNVAAVATADYKVAGVNGASYAGGTVVLTTQDATNPRVDIIVITVAGAVSAVAGTPSALTSTGGPGPSTPSAAQLEIARIFVPASGGLLSASSITDRRVALGDGAVTLTTTGDIMYASAAHTPARLAVGSANQALTVAGGVPTWAATPASVLTTTGDLLYASAANILARLGIGSTGQSLTVAGGLASWAASPTSVLTTTGDVLYASAANTLARLGVGSTGQSLTVAGGLPAWAASPTSVLTTTGDVLYASAANTLARLGVGSSSQVLTVSGGLPTWAAPAAGGPTVKYKSAAQTFTSNTTYADVTASSGNLAFSIGANEAWHVTWTIYCTAAGGNGGAKFQVTGPASPVQVKFSGILMQNFDAPTGVAVIPPLGYTSYSTGSSPASMQSTSFSSQIMGMNSGNSTGIDNVWHANISTAFTITGLVVSGSTSGTVTLQAAQNQSSADALSLAIGSFMVATKAA